MVQKLKEILAALVSNSAALAILLALTTAPAALAEERLQEANRDIPPFELQSMTDELWVNESLHGKPWVINFWATWCPPCIEEIPSMNAAWEILEKDGYGMLAINAGEGESAVEIFLGKVPIDFPVLLGGNGSLPNWSVRGLPTTLIVNADGKIIFEVLGPREWDDEALLEQLIGLK